MITEYVKNNRQKNVNYLKCYIGYNVLYLLTERIKRRDVVKRKNNGKSNKFVDCIHFVGRTLLISQSNSNLND